MYPPPSSKAILTNVFENPPDLNDIIILLPIQRAVPGVVGRVSAKERHKIQMALEVFKAKLTQKRGERYVHIGDIRIT